jgi:hypothetical protein
VREALVIITVLAGCAEHGSSTGGPADGAQPPPTCAVGDATKIKFTQDQGCGNDGGVEFCIPDNDAVLRTQLTAISSTITCAAGGGRAGCLAVPGLLLCSYPTAFPAQCTSTHGAMTDDVWGDMCQISSLPQITEIVPTILE